MNSLSDGSPVIEGGTDGTVIGNVADAMKVNVTNSIVINPDDTSFAFGDRTLAATTEVVLTRATYTEQTTNAQRSVVSSSVNDSAVGTGVRQVKITYLTATMTGPFETTVTLNGIIAVNTSVSDICYIEDIEAVSVGTGNAAAGIISLKSAIAGAGVTITQINTGDLTTLNAIHYVPVGVGCYVTGISCSHSGTTVGSGAVYRLRRKDLGSTTPLIQVSDFVRLYGQSSTFARTYTSPIKVLGPAKLELWVAPESTSSTIYRGSFDFYNL